MNVFDEIRERVPLSEIFNHYGLMPNRRGFVRCPLHAEKTPSLKLYPDERWFCFGCSAGGDGVKLVELLDNLPPAGAARHISDVFKLNLFPDKPLNAAEKCKVAEATEKHKLETRRLKAFEQWENNACRLLREYIRQLSEQLAVYTPINREFSHPLYARTCGDLLYAEYLFDTVFINGDFEQKARFYKSHGKEMQDIEQRVKHFRQIEIVG